MKTIRKNFLLLAFAAGALFLIGNNVFADPTTIIAAPGDQVGGGGITYCMKSGGFQASINRSCTYDPFSIPPYKCGMRMMIYDGSGLTQCY